MRIYEILQVLFVKKKEKSTKKAGNISSPFVVALFFNFYIFMLGQHTVFGHGEQRAAVQIAVGIAKVTKAFTIFFLVLRMFLPLFRRYSVCNAYSISAKISLTFSMPTDRRIKSGVTPHSTNSLSESWRCVEDAGCNTQVRASATCVTIAASFKEFINFSAASLPPLTPNEITPQVPLGIYFWASAWYLLSGSPG